MVDALRTPGRNGFPSLGETCGRRCTDTTADSTAWIIGGNPAMTVERRYSKRYPVDFEVKFRYRDLYPCTSHALDLSVQGMLLATQSSSPPTGVYVEITFTLAGSTWKIPAVVAHSTPGRMGVMFREAQPRLYRATTKRSEDRRFHAAPASAVH